MKVDLVRTRYTADGVFGEMLDETGSRIAVTLERSYGPSFSPKIPEGVYRCDRTIFQHGRPRPYVVWEVCSVPGHSRVLIHPANVETELDGCIAVGLREGDVFGRPGVLGSRAAFRAFMAFTSQADELTLEVRRVG